MVKPGYKQTEIGTIPDTWQVIPLQDLCIKNGIVRGPFGGALKKEIFVAEGYKVYEQGNAIYKTINRGSYYVDAAKYQEMLRFAVQAGDFIVSCSGTIGMIFQIPANAPKGIINQALLKLKINNDVVNPQYFYLYFSCDFFNKRIVDDTQGGAMKNLVGMDVFRDTLFPIPPMPEQENIGKALTDITEFIANLETLIAKKQTIKQGAMQELLTGKRRLPGFSGDWQTISLKKALSVGHGMSQHDVECPTGRYPILATGGVIGRANRYLWNAPSVLIGRKGTINKPQYMDKPFWSIDTLFYTKINEGYCPKFLYYVFCRIDWLSYNEASGVPSLSARTIESMEVQVPDYREQYAIAGALTDIDTEREALEQKLGKYRQVKQGMMQQLLTGKIRLTEDR